MLACAGPLHAGEAEVFTVRPDGSVIGVPAPFAPMRLQARGLGTATASVALRAGERAIAVPACVSRRIRSASLDDVRVLSSLHAGAPLIEIAFRDPAAARSAHASSGLHLLFDLRAARLVQGEVHTVDRAGGGVLGERLDVSPDCQDDARQDRAMANLFTGAAVLTALCLAILAGGALRIRRRATDDA